MTSSPIEIQTALARDVKISDEALIAELEDGRTISVPLAWYPRLLHGKQPERANWRLIGKGEGIHWPELDEDIKVEQLLIGRPSGESQKSLQQWLKTRSE
jgi:hypothetical protein